MRHRGVSPASPLTVARTVAIAAARSRRDLLPASRVRTWLPRSCLRIPCVSTRVVCVRLLARQLLGKRSEGNKRLQPIRLTRFLFTLPMPQEELRDPAESHDPGEALESRDPRDDPNSHDPQDPESRPGRDIHTNLEAPEDPEDEVADVP